MGSPADGKVYVRVTGDATLSASFRDRYKLLQLQPCLRYAHQRKHTLLPYEIRKSGSSWLKYRYDAVQRLQAESLNTGQETSRSGRTYGLRITWSSRR